jgi:hypothetical protein
MKKNLVNFVKLLSLTVVLILTTTAMVNAQGGRIDFSGTWALNTMKSSPSAANSSRSFLVKQEGNLLTTTSTGEDGMPVVTKYKLDGKESANKSEGIDSKYTAKFSSDGKMLTIVTKSWVDGKEKTDEDVWSLSDSKTLSIICTIVGTSGDEVTKFVYDRK